jgi:hypothetical protein
MARLESGAKFRGPAQDERIVALVRALTRG